MVKAYIVSGILICGLFGFATMVGLDVFASNSEQGGKPKGPGQYHK